MGLPIQIIILDDLFMINRGQIIKTRFLISQRGNGSGTCKCAKTGASVHDKSWEYVITFSLLQMFFLIAWLGDQKGRNDQ